VQVPGLEERRPVDVLGNIGQVVILEVTLADELWLWRCVIGPVDFLFVGARSLNTDEWLRFLIGVLLTHALVLGLQVGLELVGLFV